MDNASINRGPEIEGSLRARVEVKLVYLPPYSPDKNPIEEFFAELKAFIKKQWMIFEANPKYEFKAFLEWCVGTKSVEGKQAHEAFSESGVTIQET
jgi:hypothetical protein